MPTSYEGIPQPLTTVCSEVATTPTNLVPPEATPTITLNDQRSFVWPSGGLTNFENTNKFLRQLQKILTPEDIEGFAVNVNRAVKCLFSNKVEIAATFVIQGETGNKKHGDNGSFTGDLYMLDKEDQLQVSNINVRGIPIMLRRKNNPFQLNCFQCFRLELKFFPI